MSKYEITPMSDMKSFNFYINISTCGWKKYQSQLIA